MLSPQFLDITGVDYFHAKAENKNRKDEDLKGQGLEYTKTLEY